MKTCAALIAAFVSGALLLSGCHSKESTAQTPRQTTSSAQKVQQDSQERQSAASQVTLVSAVAKQETKPENPAKQPDPPADNDAPEKTFDLTFDDLKFEMEKGDKFVRSMLTPEINSYHEGTVRLRGYIRPSFSQTGLTKFIFVRDNKECCFGPGAAIFDCVLVRLAQGSKTNYTVRPIAIEGRFTLKEYKGPDGNVWSIYRMNDAKVK